LLGRPEEPHRHADTGAGAQHEVFGAGHHFAEGRHGRGPEYT